MISLNFQNRITHINFTLVMRIESGLSTNKMGVVVATKKMRFIFRVYIQEYTWLIYSSIGRGLENISTTLTKSQTNSKLTALHYWKNYISNTPLSNYKTYKHVTNYNLDLLYGFIFIGICTDSETLKFTLLIIHNIYLPTWLI